MQQIEWLFSVYGQAQLFQRNERYSHSQINNGLVCAETLALALNKYSLVHVGKHNSANSFN